MDTKKYFIYYDESFHDRAITLSNNEQETNLFKKNISDAFIGAFIGFNESEIDKHKNRYILFEQKHKTIMGLSENQELKGTSFLNMELILLIKTVIIFIMIILIYSLIII